MKPKQPSTAKTNLSPNADTSPENQPEMAELYRRAEAELRKQHLSKPDIPLSESDCRKLLHELQVHQVELELQNTELKMARNALEEEVEKYTDLYDFSPMGYFSIDESGVILEANLTGAVLLGVDRSQLINRRLQEFVSTKSRPCFLNVLQEVFSGSGDRACETQLLPQGDDTFWASFRAAPANSPPQAPRWCRVAFANITSHKKMEEANRRTTVLDEQNRKLKQEVARRKAVEKSLKQSQRNQSRLLARARVMQQQRQQLSRQVLRAQEEERRKISRELHDVIAQTLSGISVQLAALKQDPSPTLQSLTRQIARTQQQVERSVNIVQRFARELRPAVLDDLGLIPALQAFMKNFITETGIRVQLTTFAEVEELGANHRTALFRVAQEALSNVALHARASQVRVDLQRRPNHISMTIADDGISFNVDQKPRKRGRKGLGLIGMKERLEMVNGQFDIQSEPGKGTTIEARIPLPKGSRGEQR